MDRRDFLKLAGASIPAWGMIPIESKAQSLYTGKLLVNIHADGGISQEYFLDPREVDPTMNSYSAARIPAGVAGNIRFGPVAANAAFFARYFNQMLVINGVNSETNSHEDGDRCHAAGTLAMGYPNISELFASVKGASLPFPWMAGGGFTASVGLSPAAAVPNGNTFLSTISPNTASATQDYMKTSDFKRTLAVRAERLKALEASGGLTPRGKAITAQFAAASDSRALLDRVAQVIPATFDNQAHVALVAMQAGITTTVQLATGGFDGHGDIANSYQGALPRLTTLIDYIWTRSAQLGISDRILLRVYSEFGRTPGLNSGNGKDHHSIGSQILMEAAPAWGNRVFGAAGPRLQGLKINTATGAVDPVNGVMITPRHIHTALRKYLGIETTDPRYALKVPASENFDFFNPNAKTGYPNL